ncbi:IclR family transcriptional regulator [Chitinasiproducens palmae]|uniref:DNA-binding transcriptional regulator, IclR family n=1 Tax=Chitinasiproducens palmae TaxID=1770053 RepID=A0A1H2PTV2_9BURK|nr:IclR family transcriptional regulator [Chitinasiproducens palmae]SDV50571.1 DNA-binding transcriptional regulator, IclR family [Chitinasiproducens palmae]
MSDERRGIGSIEVGGKLLHALVDNGAPLSLGELAKRAGMSSAKAHPYLVSYGKIGLVQQDPITGQYELGSFALQMGLISLQMLDPIRIAIPEVITLGGQLGHTAAIASLGTYGPTIVFINESSQPIHVNIRAGTAMPLLRTSTGRSFAAYLAPTEVERLLASEPPHESQFGGRYKALTRKEIDKMLAEVREHGMSRAVDEPVSGISSVAAPVFDRHGKIILVVTSIGPSGTLDARWDSLIAHDLKQCARRISARLGHNERASPSGQG